MLIEADGSANYFGGIAAVASRILNHHLNDLGEEQAPLLARCRAARQQMRERLSQRSETRAVKARTADRRKMRIRAMIIPQYTDPFERRLRKISTQGVVTLFNAIKRHQLDVERAEQKTADDLVTARERKRMKAELTTSKAQFLQLLNSSRQNNNSNFSPSIAQPAVNPVGMRIGTPGTTKELSSTWRVLDEDMLLGSQSTSSWGKDVQGVEVSDDDPDNRSHLKHGIEDEVETSLWGDDEDDSS